VRQQRRLAIDRRAEVADQIGDRLLQAGRRETAVVALVHPGAAALVGAGEGIEPEGAEALALRENIEIKVFRVIYDLIDYAKEKIKSAVSDVGGNGGKGGNNLLSIFKAFAETKNEKSEYGKFEKEHKAGKLKYAEFKPRLAELISDYFADFRKKRVEFSQNPDYVKKVLEEGAEKASAIAEKTLKEVKEKIGLVIG